MTSCKECLHIQVCVAVKAIGEEQRYAEQCKSFKNKDDYAEVVRCENCKYFIPDAELDKEKYQNIIEADGYCDNCLRYTDKTDYCSSGRRK